MTGLSDLTVLAKPELIADTHCETGEGPLWHPDEGCLYWTDIPAGKLYRFWPERGEHELIREGSVIGGMTLQADGALLLMEAEGSMRTWRPDGTEHAIRETVPGGAGTRFNDAIADPKGRVFSGLASIRDAEG